MICGKLCIKCNLISYMYNVSCGKVSDLFLILHSVECFMQWFHTCFPVLKLAAMLFYRCKRNSSFCARILVIIFCMNILKIPGRYKYCVSDVRGHIPLSCETFVIGWLIYQICSNWNAFLLAVNYWYAILGIICFKRCLWEIGTVAVTCMEKGSLKIIKLAQTGAPTVQISR